MREVKIPISNITRVELVNAIESNVDVANRHIEKIPESVMDIIEEKFNWDPWIIKKLADIIDWNSLLKNRKLPEHIIESYPKELGGWDVITKHQVLSENFLKKHRNKISWHYLLKYQKISEGFIESFKKDINWGLVVEFQKLSEGFIERLSIYHFKELDILRHQKLSESYIRKRIKNSRFNNQPIFWIYISTYQKDLSCSFIKEYASQLDWYYLSKFQTLPERFVKEYCSKINMDLLFLYNEETYKNFSLDFLIDNIKYIKIENHQKYLSEEDFYILKNIYRVNK